MCSLCLLLSNSRQPRVNHVFIKHFWKMVKQTTGCSPKRITNETLQSPWIRWWALGCSHQFLASPILFSYESLFGDGCSYGTNSSYMSICLVCLNNRQEVFHQTLRNKTETSVKSTISGPGRYTVIFERLQWGIFLEAEMVFSRLVCISELKWKENSFTFKTQRRRPNDCLSPGK